MQVLQSFFATNFTYSTWQEPAFWGKTNETALGRFLLRTRRGHCEYFATATVLLLRQLGFHARYAVGYAVHETGGENRYVVRQRDAHAWCLVWNNGVWHDFDTTPGSWIEEEAQLASPFERLSDFFSRLRFEIARVRWGQSHLREYLLYTSLPLLGILLVRIFRTRRKRRSDPSQGSLNCSWPGSDSELYELEMKFARRGMPRAPAEPLAEWLTRAAAAPEFAMLQASIHELLRLHYRYRFDPLGLRPDERVLLRSQVAECLTQLTAPRVTG
jgi:transglutaminase-like putative cysteine protease